MTRLTDRTTDYGDRLMKRNCEPKKIELKNLAKMLAVKGVRNDTDLETLHSGIFPSSETGDYSDVKVITPYGEIEWNRLSRISDEEMRSLMLSIERALENALSAYKSLDSEDKELLMDVALSQRTYDRRSYGLS